MQSSRDVLEERRGAGLTRGHSVGLLAFGGAYWPVAIPTLCGSECVLVVSTEGGGGLEPKSVCTQNGPIQYLPPIKSGSGGGGVHPGGCTPSSYGGQPF